jgi:hypothetical protein
MKFRPRRNPLVGEMKSASSGVLYGDGYWYALYSIAKKGHRQLGCLAFERNVEVTEDSKAEMWRVLGLAEKLSRELLAEKDSER